jgi:hypothetical protein
MARSRTEDDKKQDRAIALNRTEILYGPLYFISC